jgi:hypothetical protein
MEEEMFGTTAKKKSFTDLVESVGAAKHNSDLLNLANALVSIRGHKRDLEKLEAELLATVKSIEDGDEQDVEVIKGLFDRANGYQFRAQKLRR